MVRFLCGWGKGYNTFKLVPKTQTHHPCAVQIRATRLTHHPHRQQPQLLAEALVKTGFSTSSAGCHCHRHCQRHDQILFNSAAWHARTHTRTHTHARAHTCEHNSLPSSHIHWDKLSKNQRLVDATHSKLIVMHGFWAEKRWINLQGTTGREGTSAGCIQFIPDWQMHRRPVLISQCPDRLRTRWSVDVAAGYFKSV